MMGSGSATGENRARAAAEAAISSPLLEDVNLSGAHGLLINVTAGMDLRTSEFHVVGDTVKQYASEDATVVVGYVIDPEMTDQIRVTVVATGIGRPSAVRGMPAHTLPPKVEVVQSRARRRPLDNYAGCADWRRRRRRGEDVLRLLGDDAYLMLPRFSAGKPTENTENRGQSPFPASDALRRFRGNGDDPAVLSCPAERSRHAQTTHAEELDPGYRGRSTPVARC